MRSRLLVLGFPEQSIRHKVQEVVSDSRRDAVFIWWVRGGIGPVIKDFEIETSKDDAGAEVPGDPKMGCGCCGPCRAVVDLVARTVPLWTWWLVYLWPSPCRSGPCGSWPVDRAVPLWTAPCRDPWLVVDRTCCGPRRASVNLVARGSPGLPSIPSVPTSMTDVRRRRRRGRRRPMGEDAPVGSARCRGFYRFGAHPQRSSTCQEWPPASLGAI